MRPTKGIANLSYLKVMFIWLFFFVFLLFFFEEVEFTANAKS